MEERGFRSQWNLERVKKLEPCPFESDRKGERSGPHSLCANNLCVLMCLG